MRTAEVDIWTVALNESRPPVLSPAEVERASRFRFPEHRLHWTNAHSALREILAGYLGQAPLTLQFAFNTFGKPSVSGLEFNLSHSSQFAVIAVSHDAAVGIDIERLRPEIDMAKLLRRLGETDLPIDAAGLHQRWAKREAASKAQGRQLFDPLDPGIAVTDLAAPAGYVAAVAAVGATPVPRYCGKR